MASLLQQELAQVLQRDLPHLFSGGLVPSISTVKVTPDLAVARVYLSLLIGNDAPERLDAIREHTKEIRYALGKRIGKQTRVVPELTFYHDDSAAYAAHMEQVLGKLDIPAPAPEAQGDEPQTSRPRFNPKNDDNE